MKRFPVIKFLQNLWQTIECMLRVWDYNKFRKSLIFSFRLLKNRQAVLKFKLDDTSEPMIFTFHITGDIMVFIPLESGTTNSKKAGRPLPGRIRRQLEALMYAPQILLAMITEFSVFVFIILKYREELMALVESFIVNGFS